MLTRPFAHAGRGRHVREHERVREPEARRPATRPAARVFLAEHYQPGLDAERLEALTGRLRAAAALWRGDAVRVLASASVPGDDTLLSIFSASSPDAVAWTARRAEVAADRIVPIVWRAQQG